MSFAVILTCAHYCTVLRSCHHDYDDNHDHNCDTDSFDKLTYSSSQSISASLPSSLPPYDLIPCPVTSAVTALRLTV